MTTSHGVKGTDVYASGDTVLLAYDDAGNGLAAIYANVSFDGGITWEGERQVSDTHERCIEPSVVISQGMGRISWSDSRDNPQPRYYEIYYDQGQLATGINDDGSLTPGIDFDISVYPNPFNSGTTINLTNLKGGEARIAIYDITGRLVKRLTKFQSVQGGEIKAAWDATDNFGKTVGSGIYFARVSTPQAAGSLKIVLLK
jgi:hypothetical protein